MFNIKTLVLSILSLAIASCGYQLGGTKPPQIEFAKTIKVCLFENNSLEPRAGALLSGALADEIQRDGTYALSTTGKADVRLEGTIKSISFDQLRSSRDDTYKSIEYGLRMEVTYRIVDSKTNNVLYTNSVEETGEFYDSGNIQTARTSALSYAARLVATSIAECLTNG